MIKFTEQEIQEIINVLAEAPAKYTMAVIMKLAEKTKLARIEDTHQKDQNENTK